MNSIFEKKYYIFLLKILILFNLYSVNVFSQIEIVDQSHHDLGGHLPSDRSSLTSNDSAQLLLKVQNLEKELRYLRGSVEELNYVLDQLRQNRIDDYLDLDLRLTNTNLLLKDLKPDLKNSKGSKVVEKNSSLTVNQDNLQEDLKLSKLQIKNNPSIEAAYRNAYQLVKEQKFQKAKLEFINFIEKNNDPYFSPKSYFWLGELYYWSEEYIKSKEIFDKLISEYPDHRKVPDSRFKLGKILFKLGEKKAAKKQLEDLIKEHPNSPTLNPAKEYLRNNLR